MRETANPPPTSASDTTDELRQEASRLKAENTRLRNENRRLRGALDAFIARMQSTAMFGPCEMSAGTSAASAPPSDRGTE